MKFIVAGNYNEYLDFIRQLKLNPNKHRFVDNCILFAGIENPDVSFIGTAGDREDISDILDAIRIRTRKVIA